MVEGLAVVNVGGRPKPAWYDGERAHVLGQHLGDLATLITTLATADDLPAPTATLPPGAFTLLPPLTPQSRVIAVADEEAALRAVAGYTIANDGSARDLQPTMLAGKQVVDWFSAKSLDRCSALGPVIVPATRVADVAKLRIVTTMNVEIVQDDYASSMHVGIGALVSFISWRMALAPGDLILTGTPAGVGKARGRLLSDGDVVTISVAGLGELTTSYHSRTKSR